MPFEGMRYVICYDVPDDKRRVSLASCLDAYGDRVQYSVFEVVLDRALFERLRAEIEGLILPSEDRVTVYMLCGACEPRALRLGRSSDVPGMEKVFIV